MVYARLPRAAASIDVTAGGRRHALPVRAAAAPLVERALAGAELAELEARLPSARGEDGARLRTLIAHRSVEARVLSSETSMLVLESDADYARYGIDRRALADVLTVGPSGIERQRRGDVAPIPTRTAPTPAPAPTKQPMLASDAAPRLAAPPHDEQASGRQRGAKAHATRAHDASGSDGDGANAHGSNHRRTRSPIPITTASWTSRIVARAMPRPSTAPRTTTAVRTADASSSTKRRSRSSIASTSPSTARSPAGVIPAPRRGSPGDARRARRRAGRDPGPHRRARRRSAQPRALGAARSR